MDPLILLVLFVACIIIFFSIFSSKKSSKNKPSKSSHSIEEGSYVLNTNLLSNAELSFYHSLNMALPDEVSVFSKVRIADIVSPKKGIDRKLWSSLFLRISQKHFDFVLCDAKTMFILGVVELDDKSHNTKKAKERDKLINDVCNSAGLTIYRFKASSSYVIEDLRKAFENINPIQDLTG